MSSIPRKFPVYTIDPYERIREYTGVDAWELLRKPYERRIYKKDLPKKYEVYEQLNDIDV